tara:strand:- start:659 stop:1828 length:1170 start_codon:yes stop_codon:yes gene_type:complete
MAVNNRIFYACQLVGINPMASTSAPVIAHGVQTVGITTNFNLEQAFELGQIQIYENIEGLPDVEITMEKVFDGYPLLYHLCSPNAVSNGLVGRGKERCDLYLGIYSDAFDAVTDGAQTTPQVEIYCSGAYLGNVSYTIPVDGNCTESITLTGNQKEWKTTGQKLTSATAPNIDGTDMPANSGGFSGGIQRRENVKLERCILPADIYGIQSQGEWGTTYPATADADGDLLDSGNGFNFSTGQPRVHLQNISISTDFSREDILELGKKSPYFKSPNFPIEVTCEIEAIAISGDFVGAYELGDPTMFSDPVASGDNTKERRIMICMQDRTAFDLGKKNRLSSVSYGGGDAAGGNVSITYSYTNFNELSVTAPKDPALNGTLYSPEGSGFSNL